MDDITKTDKMLSRKDGLIGYLIFNNPERHNAVSLDMWDATSRILDDFAKDDEVRVVVITGAGGKAFVSGADIWKFEAVSAPLSTPPSITTRPSRVQTSLCRRVSQADHPAMIRGYCIGGGLGLAVCCDLRICSDNSKPFRGARREARAGLLLCRPAPARRCGRAGLRQGNLLHRAAVRC